MAVVEKKAPKRVPNHWLLHSQMATILTGRPVLTLYRQLLKAAIVSPTKKRDSIVKEIQNGTRRTQISKLIAFAQF